MKNNEYETIRRKDGITYERKKRNNNFDCHLNIKFHKENIEKLKKIADIHGVKYNFLVREIINKYIKEQGY